MSTNQNWQQLFKAADTIYTNYGTETVKSETLLKNLFADLAPDCKNETTALFNALSNQTISHIVSGGSLEDINYLVNHLRTTTGLSREWSENISVCIFKLHGKQDVPSKDNTQTTTKTQPSPTTPPAKKTQTPEQKLISSGYSFLRNEKWDKATARFDQSLQTKAYARAYIGKLLAQLHISVESDLPFTNYDILNDPNWLNAVSIATGNYKQKLERYAREHQAYVNKKLKKPAKSIPIKNRFMHGTGIFFLLVSICFALGVWFTDRGAYSPIEFFMTTFFTSALGEALVLFSQDNGRVSLKRNMITFFAVSVGIPLTVMLAGLLVDAAILLFVNFFGT